MKPVAKPPLPASVPALVCTLGLCCLATVGAGCSGWKPFWTNEKAAREREKYGPTADQRIKQLGEAAKRAKAGTGEEREAFTRKLVEDMLAEHDPRVRARILEAAAGFDTAAAAAVCRGAVHDPDQRVRLAACAVWAKRPGAESVELLTGRYRSDPDNDVRLAALRSLGELGDKAAIPVLARALEDADPAAQYRAVGALKKVSGRDLGDDVNAWRAWAADPEGASAEWSIAETFRKLF